MALSYLLAALIMLQRTAGEDLHQAQVQSTCCSQVFLSSTAKLAESAPFSLGIYTLSSQKIASNPHPVYVKHSDTGDYFLYFRKKDDNLPQGWVVGPQLLEDSFYITTFNSHSHCPAGIFGGYESSETSSRDESFSIDCHSDVVKVQCCPNIKVTSTLQPGLSGDYEKVGDYNGHTLYQGGPLNSSLFYRKVGHGPDGWVVGMDLEEASFIITTRAHSYCPDAVTATDDKTTGLRISCEAGHGVDLDYQDPGIPAAPLEILKPEKAISAGARQTLFSSLCFRIIAIAFLLIMRLAEDVE